MICAVAGMTADANILINYARQAAQQYLLTYNQDIPCEQLVRRLCDLKQGYTQHGGLRPFGVSFIYAGYDPHRHFQLYQSNPSGNYGGWKATSVGANNASAQSLLKQDYNEDCNLKEACGLAVKVLSKTMDSTKLSSEKSMSCPSLHLHFYPLSFTFIYLHFHPLQSHFNPLQSTNPSSSFSSPTVEFATVGRTSQGNIYHHLWGADEIDALLKEHGLAKPADDPESTEQAMGTAGYAENRGET